MFTLTITTIEGFYFYVIFYSNECFFAKISIINKQMYAVLVYNKGIVVT